MTAEKGEHERAPPVCESWPTPLRATLRAPPAKWAVEAFFPAGERSEPRSRTARRAPADRSPRRIATWAASGVAVPRAFFGTFFRFERKYYPLRGGSPTVRAGVGASSSTRGKGYAPAGAPKGFPLALWKPSGTEVGEKTMERQFNVRTVVGASIPRRESSYSKVGFQRCLHIAFLGANNRRDAPLGVCLPTKRRPIRLQAPNPAPQPHGVDFLIARRLPSS